MQEEYYYRCCQCEYLYHCFGREEGKKIKNGNTDLEYSADYCSDFYPEIKP